MPDTPSFDRSFRGYERTQVDIYLTRVADAREALVPAPARPEFTLVLYGYDRAQVDRYLDGIGRGNDQTPSWSVRHFSQADDSVPELLRRVAGSIEALGPVEVQDVVFHTDITEDRAPHSMTVYFHAAGDET